MISINRDMSIINRNKRKLCLFMSFYLMILIILSFESIDDKSPVTMLFDTSFRDNGNIIDYKNFVFPISFLVIHFVPVFFISEILYKDHLRMGTYTIPKFGTKRKYLISKVMTSVIYNFLTGILFFTLLILALSLKGSNEEYKIFGLIRIGIFYTLENIVLGSLVIIISIFYSFNLALIYLLINLLGAIFTNWMIFLGQGSLLMKQDFYGGYFTLSRNVLFIILYFIIIVSLIGFFPKRMNYYGRKND